MTRLQHQPTIGPNFWNFTEPLKWVEYVKGLRIVAPSKASKSVPEITLHTAKKFMVKITRPQRQVTEDEMALLAAEYAIEPLKLRELFTARKIRIVNADGDQTNGKLPRPKSGRPPGSTGKRKAKKTDAGSEPAAGRQDTGSNQLLEPRVDPDMPAQSEAQPARRPTD